jgi:conjugative relaxase-like TrwC/TraI family protein
MSLHKLTAGNGYTYLTRQVAAADATDLGHTSLGEFYAQKGESPGEWVGAGLCGLDGIDLAGPVSAEQMKALFGHGRHPNADSISAALVAAGNSPAQARAATALGKAFAIYDRVPPFRIEVAARFAAYNQMLGVPGNATVPADVRARIRTEVGMAMFTEKHERPPSGARELSGFIARSSQQATTAVAGYDLTFSPVKSISALWAVAPAEVAAQIQEAHQGAVASALRWLERDAVFTRAGSSPQRRQIEVTGLVGVAFVHRDSRSGDPDLHTHVAISNKVQTHDGLWRALDGRVLFKAAAAASARYDTRIEAELTARLGVGFAPRPGGDPSRRAVREIAGFDLGLCKFWSSRRADIVVRLAVLSGAFQVDHGRPPTAIESIHLAQQATLETRQAKHSPRSYKGQRATWAAQSAQVLGSQAAVASMVTAATGTGCHGQKASEAWVGQAAARVVGTLSG